MSPAAILLRLLLSVLANVCTLVYVAVCLALGHAVNIPATATAFIMAACVAPPLAEVRRIMDEIEAHIKHMAG